MQMNVEAGMRKRVVLSLLAMLLLALVGCSQPDNPVNINVQLTVSPDPPLVGTESVTVLLSEDGVTVTGASV